MIFKRDILLLFLLINFVNATFGEPNVSSNGEKTKDKNINSVNKTSINSNPYSALPSEELIDTMYPDPLAEDFIGKKDDSINLDRSKSVNEMLDEFNNLAKSINDATDIPADINDNHTLEDRKKIESKAEYLLNEKRLIESANNRGENHKIKDYSELDYIEKDKNIGSLASSSINVISDSNISVNLSEEEDPEFSDNRKLTEANDVENSLNDIKIDIPDYEKLQGIIHEGDIESANQEKLVKESNANHELILPKKNSKRELLRKKMSIPLAPVLLTQGKPNEDDSEFNKDCIFTGLLIPEKQPISSGKSMIRWVIEDDNGDRIPLKSNLMLLQNVRNKDLISDFVTIKGKMITSGLSKDLKYLVCDEIRKGRNSIKNATNLGNSDNKDNSLKKVAINDL